MVAIGAPQKLHMGAMGSACLYRTEDEHLASSPTWSLHAPDLHYVYSMGEVMAQANVVETHYTPSLGTRADGFELLAGAPGTPGDDELGWLTWWISSYPAAADISSPDSYSWSYGGEWRPAGASTDARFGASLVVDGHDGIATSVEYPKYVVVGAPGEQKVYILEVDPSAMTSSRFAEAYDVSFSPPLSPLVPDGAETAMAEDFGATLLLRDLNGDGFEDLVIGAPTGTSGNTGYVYVLPGKTASGGYFRVSERIVLQPSWPTATAGPDDGFGASLAAGPLSGPIGDSESLVVGAPGLDLSGSTDAGGLCVYSFQFDGTSGSPSPLTLASSDCYENPYSSLGLSGMAWSEALAVGNVVPFDSMSSRRSDHAKASELVVGCPGCPEVDVDSSWNWVGRTAQEGSVFVYGSTDGDPLMLDTCTEEDDQWLAQVLPTLGSDFPSGLALLDVQRNGALDVVAMQASEDQVQLTHQVEENGIDEPLAGSFHSPDAVGGDWEMGVQDLGGGTIRLDLLTQFTLSLGMDDDTDTGTGGWDYCSGNGLAEETVLPEQAEDVPFALGTVEAPTPGGGPVEVSMYYSDGTDDYTIKADLSFEENDPYDIWDDEYILSFTSVEVMLGPIPTQWFVDCEFIVDGALTEDVVFTRAEGFQCEY